MEDETIHVLGGQPGQSKEKDKYKLSDVAANRISEE